MLCRRLSPFPYSPLLSLSPSPPLSTLRPTGPQFFLRTGTCKFGGSCKFDHPPQEPASQPCRDPLQTSEAAARAAPLGRGGSDQSKPSQGGREPGLTASSHDPQQRSENDPHDLQHARLTGSHGTAAGAGGEGGSGEDGDGPLSASSQWTRTSSAIDLASAAAVSASVAQAALGSAEDHMPLAAPLFPSATASAAGPSPSTTGTNTNTAGAGGAGGGSCAPSLSAPDRSFLLPSSLPGTAAALTSGTAADSRSAVYPPAASLNSRGLPLRPVGIGGWGGEEEEGGRR